VTHRNAHRARHGFTLVELVVVLVLLGVMLAVVTPAIIATSEDRDPATLVVGTLESARETAIRTASAVDVVVDPQAARIWISTRGGDARLDTTFALAMEGVSYQAFGSRARFHFRADGTGWGDTLIVAASGRTARVFVGSLSGAVEQRVGPAVVVSP
jgi:prepilin-type N-terminal cleavage/methylation domain-containing protein